MNGAQILRFAACAALLGTAATGNAETLQNDGFVAEGGVGYQQGFVTGEEGAVQLTLPNPELFYRLDAVQFLFGGNKTTSETVTVSIYESSTTPTPGAPLYSGDYQVTGSTSLAEVDLTAENILVKGAFRVGIRFQHDGDPSIARDDDGSINASMNFMKTQLGWTQSDLFGLTGDWVIRGIVLQQGGGGGGADAGPVGTPDAGGGGGGGGLDAGIADSCSLNSDCSLGSYCGADFSCAVDCRADVDCSDGMSCEPALGRCSKPKSSGGCTSSGGSPGGPLAAGLLLLSLLTLRRRRE